MAPIPAVIVAGPDALADWRQHPFLMFSSTAPDDSYGKIGIVPLDHPDGTPLPHVAGRSFDFVFVASFSFALIGLSVIGLFVENRDVSSPTASLSLAMTDCARLLQAPRFRVLVVAAGMLALFTVSDAFIYIGLQRTGSLALGLFPLLLRRHRVVLPVARAPRGTVGRSGRPPKGVPGWSTAHAWCLRRAASHRALPGC